MLIKYKVLNRDMKSPSQHFAYKAGRKYTCQDFDSIQSHKCSMGFYAVDIDGLPYTFRYNKHDIWRCEVGGRSVIIDRYKQRYENITLLEKIDNEVIKQLAKERECDLGYTLSEVLFPFNPLSFDRSKEVSFREIELLVKWAFIMRDANLCAIMDSVKGSVKGSVKNPVRDVIDVIWDVIWGSVGNPVWDAVQSAVTNATQKRGWNEILWHSIPASVWAYIGSFFPETKEWHYNKRTVSNYPFQCAVELWRAGLIPSYDGNTWRLHYGETAEIIFEMKGGNQ